MRRRHETQVKDPKVKRHREISAPVLELVTNTRRTRKGQRPLTRGVIKPATSDFSVRI